MNLAHLCRVVSHSFTCFPAFNFHVIVVHIYLWVIKSGVWASLFGGNFQEERGNNIFTLPSLNCKFIQVKFHFIVFSLLCQPGSQNLISQLLFPTAPCPEFHSSYQTTNHSQYMLHAFPPLNLNSPSLNYCMPRFYSSNTFLWTRPLNPPRFLTHQHIKLRQYLPTLTSLTTISTFFVKIILTYFNDYLHICCLSYWKRKSWEEELCLDLCIHFNTFPIKMLHQYLLNGMFYPAS